MSNPLTKKILGIPAWLLAAGIVAGLAIGSAGQWSRFAGLSEPEAVKPASEGPTADVTAPAKQGGGSVPSTPAGSTVPTVADGPAIADEDVVLVRASAGLSFEPARVGGRFIGYRVVVNREDPRFKAGDIVTAIGGVPVEGSPAGSELFIAALLNRDADVTLYEGAAK